jgi:hypothetical protein
MKISVLLCRGGIYLLTAFVFGVVEWFSPLVNLVPQLARAMHGWLAYIVWLIPGLIVAIIEVRRSSKATIVCLQPAVFLFTSIVAYYAAYAWDVFVIGGKSGLADLAIGESAKPIEQWRFFVGSIFPEMVEWGVIAIMTGIALGIAMIVAKHFWFSKKS